MTATMVDELEVLADEPTPAPITTRGDKPVYWQQIRTLLLSDGSTRYGCQHCDYTAITPMSIRPHLKKHKVRKRRKAGELSLNTVLARVAEMERIEAERDEWRARALAAENRLRVLRSALGGDS